LVVEDERMRSRGHWNFLVRKGVVIASEAKVRT
jgi:hypothetical protein